MAQRIDWQSMPHAELVAALEQGSEERDKRVRELQSCDKPTRKMRSGNGATEHTEAV